MKPGRPPALNDLKGRWGDPWLLGGGGASFLNILLRML